MLHTHTHTSIIPGLSRPSPQRVPSLTAPVPCVWGVCAGFLRSVSLFRPLWPGGVLWCFGLLLPSVSSRGCLARRVRVRGGPCAFGWFVGGSVSFRPRRVVGPRFASCCGPGGSVACPAFVGFAVGVLPSAWVVPAVSRLVGFLRLVPVGGSFAAFFNTKARPPPQKHTNGNAHSAVRFCAF